MDQQRAFLDGATATLQQLKGGWRGVLFVQVFCCGSLTWDLLVCAHEL